MLSGYKNPEYVYRALDLDFGLNSGFFTNKEVSTVDYLSDAFSLNSGAGASFTKYSNSPKYQNEKYISFNTGIGSNTNNTSSGYNSGKVENSMRLFSHFENLVVSAAKRSFNQKQYYFEVNAKLTAFFQGNTGSGKSYLSGAATSSDETRLTNFHTNINSSFLTGKGRIEQVQDARLALYLLEDLQKLNRLAKTASNEDVLNLAKLITQLKYKRFFDNRLRKIAEITAIDSFMQLSGIAGVTDATYFTSLADNWNYSNNPVRLNGNRLFTGFEVSYGYGYKKNYRHDILPDYLTNEAIEEQNSSGLFFVVGGAFEKAVSLKRQNSASIKAGIGMRQISGSQETINNQVSSSKSENFTEALPSMQLEANYGIGYYPNSRTWLTFNWWLLSGWDKQLEGTTRSDKSDFQNSFYTYTGPQLNAYYYLSEKLRLSFTFNGEFRLNQNRFTYKVPNGRPREGNNPLVESTGRCHACV